ncbi:Egl nine 3 [Gonapodya sp. JEL0774]|nr:Egl nine 3 [Gonapodya sp. JEL0774]
MASSSSVKAASEGSLEMAKLPQWIVVKVLPRWDSSVCVTAVPPQVSAREGDGTRPISYGVVGIQNKILALVNANARSSPLPSHATPIPPSTSAPVSVSVPARFHHTIEEAIDSLARDGFVTLDGVVLRGLDHTDSGGVVGPGQGDTMPHHPWAEDLTRKSIDMAQSLLPSLHPARLGTGVTRKIDPALRGDSVRFFSPSSFSATVPEASTGRPDTDANPTPPSGSPHPILPLLYARLASLARHISLSLHLPVPLSTPSLQLAHYPANGARYVPHKDSGPTNPTRAMTCILYLNERWKDEDGGKLRLWPGGDDRTDTGTGERKHCENEGEGEDSLHYDVTPTLDRLLIFPSSSTHAVLPTYAPRTALSVWFHLPSPDVLAHALRRRQARPPTSQLQGHPASPLRFLHSPDTTSRIFVSIPAYRDPETHHTIASLFSLALCPHRVHARLLYQDHPEDLNLHDDRVIEPWKGNVRREKFDARMAAGPVVARARLASMLEDEEFYMQVDSHMRFGLHWDARLIDLIRRCPNPNRAILTTYPPDYVPSTPPTTANPPGDAPPELSTSPKPSMSSLSYLFPSVKPSVNDTLHRPDTTHDIPLPMSETSPAATGPVILYISRFDQDGMPRVSGRLSHPLKQHSIPTLSVEVLPPTLRSSSTTASIPSSPYVPTTPVTSFGLLPSRLASAGFLFAPASLLDDVPLDPTLAHLFFGEETLYSARAWTGGWDLWTWEPDAWGLDVAMMGTGVGFSGLDDVVRHRWSRGYRRTVVGDRTQVELEGDLSGWKAERERSQGVVIKMLCLPFGKEVELDAAHKVGGKYGLGATRTVEEFGVWCGVDFRTGKVLGLGQIG